MMMPINDPSLRALVFGIPQPAPPSGQVPVQTTGTERVTGNYQSAPGSFIAFPSATSPAVRLALAVMLGGLLAYVVLRVLK